MQMNFTKGIRVSYGRLLPALSVDLGGGPVRGLYIQWGFWTLN